MHAALEVEAELQLLGCEPPRDRQTKALREHRIDPDGSEDDEHDDDRDRLPTKILVSSHDLASSGSCDDGLLTLVSADRGAGNFDTDLVGNLELHGGVVDAGDAAVDAAGRDDFVADLERGLEFLRPFSAASSSA